MTVRGGIRWIPVQLRIKRDDVLSDHPPTGMEGEDLAHPKLVDLSVCFPNFDRPHVYNFDD